MILTSRFYSDLTYWNCMKKFKHTNLELELAKIRAEKEKKRRE